MKGLAHKRTTPDSGKAILEQLQNRLKEKGVNYRDLNHYRERADDYLRGIMNGHRSATIANLAAIAESTYELVQNPAKAAYTTKRRADDVAEFWNLFSNDLRKLVSISLPDFIDRETLKNALYWAFDLPSTFGDGVAEPLDGPVPDNPFSWRGAITDPGAFFGRENELRRLRDTVVNNQSAQIIGPRRMGKSSLLYAVKHRVTQWNPKAVVAYIDMEDAACQTEWGWFRHVALAWNWRGHPADRAEFSEKLETEIKRGRKLVLCVDECEKFIDLRTEFPLAFFENLRSCGQKEKGLTVITASRKTLREIREAGALLSPWYNTIPPIPSDGLGPFSEDQARRFITLTRSGVAPFSASEICAIMDFAESHPLKLQVACSAVFEARLDGDTLNAALRKANLEAQQLLPRFNA